MSKDKDYSSLYYVGIFSNGDKKKIQKHTKVDIFISLILNVIYFPSKELNTGWLVFLLVLYFNMHDHLCIILIFI